MLQGGIEIYRQEDYAAALPIFERVRDKVPAKPNPYRWLARAKAKLGRCAEAQADWDRFLARIPLDDSRREQVAVERQECRDAIATSSSPTAPPSANGGMGTVVGSKEEVIVSPVDGGVGDGPNGRSSSIAPLVEPLLLSRDSELTRDPAIPSMSGSPVPATSARSARRRWPIWVGVAAGAALVAIGVGVGVGLATRTTEAPMPWSPWFIDGGGP